MYTLEELLEIFEGSVATPDKDKVVFCYTGFRSVHA
jgi:rhodanese-related sulfurtransferase